MDAALRMRADGTQTGHGGVLLSSLLAGQRDSRHDPRRTVERYPWPYPCSMRGYATSKGAHHGSVTASVTRHYAARLPMPRPARGLRGQCTVSGQWHPRRHPQRILSLVDTIALRPLLSPFGCQEANPFGQPLPHFAACLFGGLSSRERHRIVSHYELGRPPCAPPAIAFFEAGSHLGVLYAALLHRGPEQSLLASDAAEPADFDLAPDAAAHLVTGVAGLEATGHPAALATGGQ